VTIPRVIESDGCIPNDFASKLEYELNNSNAHTIDEQSAGGYVEHVVVAWLHKS
jgi:hypothetical protein